MKNIYFLTIALLLSLSGFCQDFSRNRRVVTILSTQNFYLNGGMRATFGGLSRETFRIDVPKNTVEWYYSVSTTPNQGQSANLQLTSQLSRLFDPTGFTSIAILQIMSPTGSGTIDSYLLDPSDVRPFINKVDNTGGSFRSYSDCSRKNYRNGVVVVKYPSLCSGTFYLGFKNPSSSTGISITLEVTAIVEESGGKNGWSREQLDNFYSRMLNGIIEANPLTDKARLKKLTSCVVDNLSQTVTYEIYNSMPNYKREELRDSIWESCKK